MPKTYYVQEEDLLCEENLLETAAEKTQEKE